MKKFIPYIFITAFIGTFLAVSFVGPFSSTVSGPKKAEAQSVTDDTVEEKTTVKLNDGTITDQDLPPVPIKGGSSWTTNILDATLGYGMAMAASLVFYMSGMILNMSSALMEMVIYFTIIKFKANIEGIGVIDMGYEIILNVVNMVFIFILLYMAIKTILGDGGDIKKLLVKVIMVALFINFSLFMSKVIIDASNIMSMGFLNAIKPEAEVVVKTEGGKTVKETIVKQGSVATAFMSGLKLQTTAYNPNSKIVKDDPDKGLEHFTMTLMFLGGAAFNLVAAFVFFAISFLFITRFIALLFYMIFSPVAFLGYIAPELQEYSSRWWKGFQSQVIFAPAFLLIAYLIASIISSGALWTAVNAGRTSGADLATAIATGFQSGFSVVMNYAILTALMIGGLITAKAMAAQGSAGMVAYADKARGWMQGVAGRNTLGRAAYLAGNSAYMSKLIDKSPIIGSIVKKQFDNVSNRKFGKESGKGYSDTLKEGTKQKQKIADFVASKKIGKTDELIWNEEDTNAERLRATNVIKERLKIPKGEESKIKNVISETDIEIKAIEKSILESKKKYEDLEKALLGQTPTQAEKVAIDTAKIEADRDEARLEEVNRNKTKEELKLQNIQASMSVDNAEVKRLTDEMEQSTVKIKSLEQIAKDARDALKSNYTKSLPFRSWGAGFGFLDKIFPSYVKAAEDIRKGKSRAKDIEKMMKEMADEDAKEKAKTGP